MHPSWRISHGKFMHPFPDLLDTLAAVTFIHPVDLKNSMSVIKL